MKVMVVGNGAREHALVWKLAQSPKVTEIYIAPGNAGTAALGYNLDLQPTDVENLARIADEKGIDLTVVGPEVPLALGIVDHFQHLSLPIFGPTQSAARIESSKVFAKELMQESSIPCAPGSAFSSLVEARQYLQGRRPPLVLKADGLAAGKGVTVAQSEDEALQALYAAMGIRVFGSAGERVIIEDYLEGQEVSLLAFTDGNTVVPMVPACDYKRAFDGDQGPNTGGMGGYSPPGFFNSALIELTEESILQPTVHELAKRGTPYKGVLYAGLMVTAEGPKVLEFNARFGDPEAQVILPRLKTDLVDIMQAVIEGRLEEATIEWSEEACVGVVMTSAGYPGRYQKDFAINGLDKLDAEITVFHAGTKLGEKPGEIYTDGGRVLTVVAKGKTIAEARAKVYLNLPRLHFEGCHYRHDIAAREVS